MTMIQSLKTLREHLEWALGQDDRQEVVAMLERRIEKRLSENAYKASLRRLGKAASKFLMEHS